MSADNLLISKLFNWFFN